MKMKEELDFNPLSDSELQSALKKLPGWSSKDSKISKTYDCKNFMGAISFVNRIAEIAENLNHHPDIEIHWKHVTISNWTHTKNAVTSADVVLAKEIEAVE
jgi:4a-hydroxytetrahydrobiopterin dehydratase